jgi:hypothetical protein
MLMNVPSLAFCTLPFRGLFVFVFCFSHLGTTTQNAKAYMLLSLSISQSDTEMFEAFQNATTENLPTRDVTKV